MLAHRHYSPLIAAAFLAAITLMSSAALAATIAVPGDYPTIGAAIANASPGDTVSVGSGTYHENVVVDRTIDLIGHDTGGGMPTIAVSAGTGITVAADNAVVKGLRVQGGVTGILVKDCGSVNVMECIVTGSGNGITADGAHGCAIMNNTANGNSNAGIYLLNSNGCPVYLNEVKDNRYGISIAGTSSANAIYMNTLGGNSGGNGLANPGYVNNWNSSLPVTYGYGGKQFTTYPGNYWDNLGGTDANGDGIIDKTVLLAQNNGDFAPLAEPMAGHPGANFTSDSQSGGVPLPVQFYDASTSYIVSWHWDFGDGTTSDMQSPPHIYQKAGSYTVSLTVKSVRGQDQIIRSNFIVAGMQASPTLTITPVPSATPEPWPSASDSYAPTTKASSSATATPSATPVPTPGMELLMGAFALTAATLLYKKTD